MTQGITNTILKTKKNKVGEVALPDIKVDYEIVKLSEYHIDTERDKKIKEKKVDQKQFNGS